MTTDTIVSKTPKTVDYMHELLALMEREHQRIDDMEQQITELRKQLLDEQQRRRVLSSRVDMREMA